MEPSKLLAVWKCAYLAMPRDDDLQQGAVVVFFHIEDVTFVQGFLCPHSAIYEMMAILQAPQNCYGRMYTSSAASAHADIKIIEDHRDSRYNLIHLNYPQSLLSYGMLIVTSSC